MTACSNTVNAPSSKAKVSIAPKPGSEVQALTPTPVTSSATSTLRLLEVYQRKYLGIDMVMKAICYGMRLAVLYVHDAKTKEILETNILNIVDCRMLCNSLKHFGTARNAKTALDAALLETSTTKQIVGMLTVGSFAFRVFEQIFGDLGYLQKNWFSEWSRYGISKRYKMFKTCSLICCALLELHKLRPQLLRLLHVLLNQLRITRGLIRNRLRHGSSSDMPIDRLDTVETSSVVGSPITLSPRRSPAVAGDSGFDTPTVPQQQQQQQPSCFSIVEYTRRPEVRSSLFLTRNIADLIVYLTWIEQYNPNKTLVNACGVLSGLLGVLIVWCDNKAELLGMNLKS
jgi:hypothetical protein